MEIIWRAGMFRTFDVARISMVKTRTLEALIERMGELEQRSRELEQENAQHRATIAEIRRERLNESLSEGPLAPGPGQAEVSPKESLDERYRDYQLLMAQQSLIAGLSDLDPGFRDVYEACRPYTMTSTERLYALYKATEYIVRACIPGAIVETGVWMGGSMMVVAHTLLKLGDTSRSLLLYDTYAGHPRPDSELDVDLWGNRAIGDWEKFRTSEQSSDWARVSLEEVQENMRRTGYPLENIALVKGMVEQTAFANAPEQIALLRLDTDWFESTRVALEVFYSRLSDNGVLIVDDYGHYRGQREAVDRHFSNDEAPPLLTRIDYSCRLAIKPARRPRD
jgi:O-methyltransferase